MASNRWREIERLYHAAQERIQESRAAFLESACGQDAELRREVESLLRQAENREGFARALRQFLRLEEGVGSVH